MDQNAHQLGILPASHRFLALVYVKGRHSRQAVELYGAELPLLLRQRELLERIAEALE